MATEQCTQTVRYINKLIVATRSSLVFAINVNSDINFKQSKHLDNDSSDGKYIN